MHEASRGLLKGAVSAQKALGGSETETRDLLGGMEENSVSSTRGHWFNLQANQWVFTEREKKKIELVARPGGRWPKGRRLGRLCGSLLSWWLSVGSRRRRGGTLRGSPSSRRFRSTQHWKILKLRKHYDLSDAAILFVSITRKYQCLRQNFSLVMPVVLWLGKIKRPQRSFNFAFRVEQRLFKRSKFMPTPTIVYSKGFDKLVLLGL